MPRERHHWALVRPFYLTSCQVSNQSWQIQRGYVTREYHLHLQKDAIPTEGMNICNNIKRSLLLGQTPRRASETSRRFFPWKLTCCNCTIIFINLESPRVFRHYTLLQKCDICTHIPRKFQTEGCLKVRSEAVAVSLQS